MPVLPPHNPESLSVYMPMDRHQALVSAVPLPDRTRGAVLFADISGFTPLTEKLAQELGPQRGAEELTCQLNRVFSALIDQVHCYRGSVISFNGDAITCWFEGDPGRQATACALAMQQTMTQFMAITTPADTIISLSIKVVVMTGPACRFLVGHAHIQKIEVLAGGILSRLAVAAQHLQPGEVIAGAEMIDQFDDGVMVQEWRAGTHGEQFAIITGLMTSVLPTPWLEVPEPRQDIARSWLLAPIYEQLRRGKGEFLSELRPVVTFFLKFRNLDYDRDEKADIKLDNYIRWVQTVLARYEGYLVKLTIGDKGSYLHAVFGAPIAHEDDPARAVAAALDLLAPPSELHFIGPVQIGISQGKMYAGVYGSTMRQTYDVMGTEVNVAARLMSQAKPGQILVTKRIMKATADAYEFQELEPVLLKGLAAPIPVLTVLGKHRERVVDPLKGRSLVPMIGRVADRAILAEALQALLDGHSRRVIIEGEAGIGKSRLVQDLRQQARSLGMTTLVGVGDAVEKLTPYHAWRSIFRRLFGLDLLADETNLEVRQAGCAHVLAWLQENTPDLIHLTPLLNAVLPLDFPENDLTAQMTGEVRASNTHELLVGLFRAAVNKNPLLLILEDAHWLDSASWVLTRLVSQNVQHLLLVIATRPLPDPPPDEYTFLLRTPETHYQRLEALTRAEIETLICRRLGVTNLPEPVMDLISHKAEGHPFFSEELAYALRDAGLIEIVEGNCQIAPGVGDLRTLDFPDTIQGVITSRFDHLSSQQQVALKVASVIGRSFAFHTLYDVHPVAADKLHLQDCLETLERLDITPLETPAPDSTYIFKHVITQEVVYSLMPFAQREELHRNVAEWYEHTHNNDLSSYYPLLAHHWSKTGLVSKTAAYLEKAGEQALRGGAYQEATRFFSEILALNTEKLEVQDSVPVLPDNSVTELQLRRARWMWKLGQAYYGLGQLVESRTYFERAVMQLDRPVPAKTGRLIAGLLGQIVRQLLHRLWPSRFFGRAPAATQANRLETARLYRDLADIYFFAHETALFLYVALRQINVAEYAGPSFELAQAYSVFSVITSLIGLRTLAEGYCQRALKTAQDVNQPTALAVVREGSGLYRIGIGQLARARDEASQAVEIFDRLGDWKARGDSISILGHAYYFSGDFIHARQIFAELFTTAQRHDNFVHQIWGLCWQGGVAQRLGHLDEALSSLEAALALCTETAERSAEIACLGFMAVTHCRRGEQQLAWEAADRAAHLIGQSKAMPSGYHSLDGYIGVAEVYLARWEAEVISDFRLPILDVNQSKISPQIDQSNLKSNARQACHALHTYKRLFPLGQPSAWLYQGLYDWLAGKPAKAQRAWQKSLAAAERMTKRYEQGRAHYEIGRHLVATDPARQEHLSRACEIFTQLGLTYDLARAQEALARQ